MVSNLLDFRKCVFGKGLDFVSEPVYPNPRHESG